jgi:hypothetical protein
MSSPSLEQSRDSTVPNPPMTCSCIATRELTLGMQSREARLRPRANYSSGWQRSKGFGLQIGMSGLDSCNRLRHASICEQEEDTVDHIILQCVMLEKFGIDVGEPLV